MGRDGKTSEKEDNGAEKAEISNEKLAAGETKEQKREKSGGGLGRKYKKKR